MKQLVLKLQNLPEQFGCLVDNIPTQGCSCIPNHMGEEYSTDDQPGKILEAIRINARLKAISIVKCLEEDGKVQNKRNCYVLEMDPRGLQI
jgi:hypothetical protein